MSNQPSKSQLYEKILTMEHIFNEYRDKEIRNTNILLKRLDDIERKVYDLPENVAIRHPDLWK